MSAKIPGRIWEKISEVPNPAGCPERYADVLCRLPDDTLLLPVATTIDVAPDADRIVHYWAIRWRPVRE